MYSGAGALVTGGAGFIGSHLVDRLLELGSSVSVLDDMSHGFHENVDSRADLTVGDVRDREVVAELVKEADFVFHLAADTRTRESEMGWADPLIDLDVNALGTLVMLESVRSDSLKASVVVASSAAVYGPPQYRPVDERHPTEPVSPYGVSKLASERYASAYAAEKGVSAISARIFNTYGPRQRRYVMYDLIQKLQADPWHLSVMGSGRQIRDYLYVSDTVEALLVLGRMAESKRGSTYNVSSGQPVGMIDLAKMIASKVAPDADITTTGVSWAGDIEVLLGDATAFRRDSGIVPQVSLELGLNRLIEWIEA